MKSWRLGVLLAVSGCCDLQLEGPGTMCADGPGTCDEAMSLTLVSLPPDEACGDGSIGGAERCIGGSLAAWPLYGDGCRMFAYAHHGVTMPPEEVGSVPAHFGWEVDASTRSVSLRAGPFTLDDVWPRDSCMGTELEFIAIVDQIDAVVVRINGTPTGVRLNVITADDSVQGAEGSLLYNGSIELHAGGELWWRPFEYYVWLPEGPDELHERRGDEFDWTRIEGFRPEERYANYMPDPATRETGQGR